ncbi:ABC transporter substrate-binding protein [Dyadobacter luteus]|uniref:ABC transporter substrate-binding protein n=1 Tax=Dyadobacter luteus TaxID=2259619 RepID=A0A3D8YB90_9BACT|nr:ABC transporter substrate-binding protein [Dyadobacter luteus]REA60621.1 ABC transporter substrate-binding protein [Dyadobacter luteus]
MLKSYFAAGRQIVTFCQFISFIWLFTACSSSSSLYDKTEEAFSRDLFPEKLKIKHARGFTITYRNHYKIVKIMSPFENRTDTISYVLVQRGTPHPKGFAESQVIEIPVRSLVAMSSLHIGLLGFLNAESVLTGMGNVKYVSNIKVMDRIKAGKVAEVGKDQGLNEELLISMRPDLIMAVGSPVSKINRYQSLRQAGIPVLINSEWVETTPLARAEWVKLLAALMNREADVNKKFSSVEKEYSRLAALTRKVKNRPGIITGMHSRDAWFVPNGNSYVARFLEDAGANYHWAKTSATGSLPLAFEAVYPVALKADFWLNVSITNIDSKADMLAKDARYGDFQAFKTGRIFNYNKRFNAQGANDYWESGAVNPHLVLADLISIIHPELLPKHQLFYYKQLK